MEMDVFHKSWFGCFSWIGCFLKSWFFHFDEKHPLYDEKHPIFRLFGPRSGPGLGWIWLFFMVFGRIWLNLQSKWLIFSQNQAKLTVFLVNLARFSSNSAILLVFSVKLDQKHWKRHPAGGWVVGRVPHPPMGWWVHPRRYTLATHPATHPATRRRCMTCRAGQQQQHGWCQRVLTRLLSFSTL